MLERGEEFDRMYEQSRRRALYALSASSSAEVRLALVAAVRARSACKHEAGPEPPLPRRLLLPLAHIGFSVKVVHARGYDVVRRTRRGVPIVRVLGVP